VHWACRKPASSRSGSFFRWVAAAGLTWAIALSAGLPEARGETLGDRVSVRVVAFEGGPVPGMPDRVFTGGFSPPVINARGDIAFATDLSAPNSQFGNTGSIWFTEEGLLLPLAIEGDPTPEANGSGRTYASMGERVLIDDAGHVAFGSSIEGGGGANGLGLFAQGPDGLRTVVREGEALPQDDPVSPVFGHRFDDLGFPTNFASPYSGHEYLFAGGRAAFSAEADTDDPDSTVDRVRGYWSERPNLFDRELQVLVRDGEDTDFSNISTFGQPSAISGRGETIFTASASVPDDGGAGEKTVQAILSDAGGSVKFIAQTGSEAGGDVSFDRLGGRPSINDAGNAAFRAGFDDLPGDEDSGLFKQTPLQAGILVAEGTVAPGTADTSGDGTPDFVFADFANDSSSPLINKNGNVVFNAVVRRPDGSDPRRGIWTDREGGLLQLELIALVGEQAPGLPEGTVFTSLGAAEEGLVINANDDVAFTAGFEAPDETQGRGIWAERDGELRLVVKRVFVSGDQDLVVSDEIRLPDGEMLEVDGIGFAGGSGNEDGRMSGFSDEGEIVFAADGDRSMQGAVVVVPEPTAGAPLALGLLTALRGWRVHRAKRRARGGTGRSPHAASSAPGRCGDDG